MKSFYDDKLANRVDLLVDPTVKNALKMASKPGVISLAGGIPNPELFPLKEIRKSMANILKNQGKQVLQYSRTGGLPELRKLIAERVSSKWQKQISEDEVMITTGSQQALDLLGKAFLNKNDLVVTENPTYLVALSAFNGYEVKYRQVSLSGDGIDSVQLKKVIDRSKDKIKFIYAIPTYQNPTGVSWSAETRTKVISIIKASKSLLIEDDPYGELYFNKKPPNNLASYNHQGLVIYVGSISKTLCPGLRVGYIVTRKQLINKLCLAKQGMDLHTSTLSQALAVDLLQNTKQFDLHLGNLRKKYKENCSYMMKCLNKYLKNRASFYMPTGGLFIWVTIPGMNSKKLYQKAINAGIAFMPGYAFYSGEEKLNTIRLSYATVSKSEIKEGIKRLAGLSGNSSFAR